MPLRLSRNRLYQVGAVLLLPVAGYNLFVWGSNQAHKWETSYLKSLIGGVSCLVASLIFFVVSFVKQDKLIVLCDRQ